MSAAHSTPGQFTTRKKACLKCSEAKARCSLQRPMCSRCQGRGLECHWFNPDSPDTNGASAVIDYAAVGESNTSFPASVLAVEELRYSSTPIEPSPTTLESARIGSRWMDALIPPPGRIAKTFTSQTIQYISRILKSYAKTIVKDDALPPIVHLFQPAAPRQLLVNCRTLLRMWENRAPGSESLVRETILREMNRLFEEHHNYDHITLLSACQAYLLYSMYMFFCTDPDTRAMIDTATMINLQELASAMSLTGLYPSGMQERPLPDWESWIVAEAKRRTLYIMYSFDHVFNYYHDTTSYIGTELGHLPLPAHKGLWAATTENSWKTEYERFTREWPSEAPRLEDLWPQEAEVVVKERRERADRWVESADEFGMFMFAMSNMIFGS
ncbi:hypothetical protein DFH08DRAFT_913423 [Mycena albidolilacea]|uniref:Zn(2)-C6 fungal-type domain-containing protein n=1 Tax=Mycena albidolilacea TaxID=1033008 RepID=A0AAD7A9M6_9AGAR|nr:hypothetical protein DFH08DRAFT_913423 [Mycena albidolilacea]